MAQLSRAARRIKGPATRRQTSGKRGAGERRLHNRSLLRQSWSCHGCRLHCRTRCPL